MSSKVCKPPGGPGITPPSRPVEERRHDFAEVTGPYSSEDAKQEAARCLAAVDCTFCEVCELLCPDQCITRDPDTGDILIDLDYCKGCGLCAHFCPKGAIQMEPEPSG